MKTEIRISEVRTEPKYKASAAELLRRCREFYEDPENEREYEEWRNGQHEKAAV